MRNIYQCAVLLLLALLTVSYGDMVYNGLSAEAQGRFIFHKQSKYKRQSTPTNTTITTMDDHQYYTSVFHSPGPTADSLWVDLSTAAGREEVNLTSPILTDNYRFFTLRPLPFNFPYYGHIINTVSVTTGGFLYTSDYRHPELFLLTHAIAPLQADFNPSINDTARIFIMSTSDRFTVQWDMVHNHDHVAAGPFTFQVSLFRDGTIHFVYREIPLALSAIDNGDHPVEVGLSDSFYYDELFPGNIVVRSVYEYSRIQLNATDNLANSAYVISPVLNCVMASSCEECSNFSEISRFDCEWCPTLKRCSDGIDRFTQEWFDNNCHNTAYPTCTPPVSSELSAGAVAGVSVGVVIVLAVLVLLVGGVVILYVGYRRPNSKLGLFLIEHRPKARTLNKGSASYNVETGRTELKEDLAQ